MGSVALVVLDTLRKDSFNENFDWLNGKWFDNAYSTSNWTAPAHASLFTGFYGSEVGVTAKNPLIEDENYLPEQLNEEGYSTRAFSANPFASQRWNWDRGFDRFWGPQQLKDPDEADIFDWYSWMAGREHTSRTYLAGLRSCLQSETDTLKSIKRAYHLKRYGDITRQKSVADDGASTVRNSLAREETTEDFLFINLMESHTPYYPPEEYRVSDAPVYVEAQHALTDLSPPENAAEAYNSSVSYLSDIYSDIHELLIEEYDTVITCADHGELLGEHGGLWNHTFGLYPEVTHVPLVISGDGIKSQRVEEPVSILDIHKTIAECFGQPVKSRGRDLLQHELAPTDRLIEYRGLIDPAVARLRESGWSDSRIDLYDSEMFGLVAKDGGYSYETLDGWKTDRDTTISSPERRTESLLADLRQSNAQESVVTEDQLETLENLGYL